MKPAQELLARLRSLGYTADLEGGRLKLRGPCRPPSELERRITAHRQELVDILSEDEELRRTGIVQSERQVFEIAHAHFGFIRPFDPAEHPPTKRKMWADPDKEAFFFPQRYGEAREHSNH